MLIVAVTDGLQRDGPFPHETLHQLLTSTANVSGGCNKGRLLQTCEIYVQYVRKNGRKYESVCERMGVVKMAEQSFPTVQLQRVFFSSREGKSFSS